MGMGTSRGPRRVRRPARLEVVHTQTAFLSLPSPPPLPLPPLVWGQQVDHLRARLKRAPVAGPIEVHAYAAPGAAARGGGLGRQVARFAEEITYVPTPRGPAPAIHPNKGTYGA